MRTTNWKYGAGATRAPDVMRRLNARVPRPLRLGLAQEPVGLQLHRRQMAHTSMNATRLMHHDKNHHLPLRERAKWRWNALRGREEYRRLQGGLTPWFMAACEDIVNSVGRVR